MPEWHLAKVSDRIAAGDLGEGYTESRGLICRMQFFA